MSTPTEGACAETAKQTGERMPTNDDIPAEMLRMVVSRRALCKDMIIAEKLRERDVAKHLKKRIKEIRGSWRKVAWENRSNAPDLLIMFDRHHWLVETKRPKKGATAAQAREHDRLRKEGGFEVFVINDCAAVDFFIDNILREAQERAEKLKRIDNCKKEILDHAR